MNLWKCYSLVCLIRNFQILEVNNLQSTSTKKNTFVTFVLLFFFKAQMKLLVPWRLWSIRKQYVYEWRIFMPMYKQRFFLKLIGKNYTLVPNTLKLGKFPITNIYIYIYLKNQFIFSFVKHFLKLTNKFLKSLSCIRTYYWRTV